MIQVGHPEPNTGATQFYPMFSCIGIPFQEDEYRLYMGVTGDIQSRIREDQTWFPSWAISDSCPHQHDGLGPLCVTSGCSLQVHFYFIYDAVELIRGLGPVAHRYR